MKNYQGDDLRALKVAESLQKSIPPQRKNLIFFLHEIQKELGYFPEEVVLQAAHYFSVSPAEIFGILTFYSAFKLNQSCIHHIKVCQGTACHVRGSEAIMKEFSRLLGLKPGGLIARKVYVWKLSTASVVALLARWSSLTGSIMHGSISRK